MNNICEKISIETVPVYSANICNILRNLGFSDVIAYEDINGSTFISLYVRQSDREYILSKILEWMISFNNKYGKEIPCRFRIDDDVSDAKSKIGNVYDIYVSFDDTSIELESDQNPKTMTSENPEYKDRIQKNINRIIVPIKDHEFIVSQTSYMDTYKNNLMLMHQIKNDKKCVKNIQCIGTDIPITSNLLYNVFGDNINLSTITSIDDITWQHDLYIFNLNKFRDYIRDAIVYMNMNKKSDAIIILSGIFDLYEDYYAKQLSDMKYKIFRTNRWCSFVFGDINSDIYDSVSGNGY